MKNDYSVVNQTRLFQKNSLGMGHSIDINANDVVISSIYESKNIATNKWDII